MRISQAAFDLIVAEEIGDEVYYNKTERHPDWPGGASGVTIGIGYDCGYATRNDILHDWADKLDKPALDALCAVAGIHGSPASSHAHELRGVVDVPLNVALDVFRDRDVPKWERLVSNAVTNTNLLSGDSFGALVSLAFNRGASFGLDGDRYREMRAIKFMMYARQFDRIPAEFYAMKRLWPNVSDLRHRRDHEAALFQKGLSEAPLVASADPGTVPGDVAAAADNSSRT